MVSDSHVMIGGSHYHMECQSTADGTMVVRMFAYDVQIAMRHARMAGDVYMVEFPRSAVFYLRSTRNTPDSMEVQLYVPEDSCRYQIPAIKIEDYSVDDLFERKLYFFLPFYIFFYEKDFAEYEADESRRRELEQVFCGIRGAAGTGVCAGDDQRIFREDAPCHVAEGDSESDKEVYRHFRKAG